MQRASLLLSVFAVAVGVALIRAEDSVPAPMPPRPVADAGDNLAAKNQIVIKARLCESDSAKHREKGSLKVIAEPTMVTVENRPFSFLVGGEKVVVDHAGDGELIETGQRVEGKVGAVSGGRLSISMSFSHTVIEDEDDDGVVLHTECTRVLTTVVLGETTRLDLTPRGRKEKIIWVDLTFDQAG